MQMSHSLRFVDRDRLAPKSPDIVVVAEVHFGQLWACIYLRFVFLKKIRKTDGKRSVLLFTIHGIIFREKVILVNCQPLS